MTAHWTFDHCCSLAREIVGNRSRDELGYLVWNFTGYPGVFTGDRETWDDQVRTQLKTYLNAEAAGPATVDLLMRCGGCSIEHLPRAERCQHLFDWLRCQPKPITTRDVEHKLGIRRSTAIRDLNVLEERGVAERFGTGEHQYPMGHHLHGQFSILWQAVR